jgi:hypothetical protein
VINHCPHDAQRIQRFSQFGMHDTALSRGT